MNNKVLIELVVPKIDEVYNVYLPINRKIGNIIELINKSLEDLTNGIWKGNNKIFLYDSTTGNRYDLNQKLIETNIRNGSRVILL